MLDLGHLINPSSAIVQEFTSRPDTQWQPYTLPRGKSMVFISSLGAGGGGGNGRSAASGTAKGGGGGGGGGAVNNILIPRIFLPDTIFIRVGKGGGAVAAGSNTYVSIQPTTANSSAILICTGGSAGATASSGTGGAGGAGGGLLSAVWQPYSSDGMFISRTGSAGVAGGSSGAVGNNFNAPVCLTTGGAGGGSSDASNVPSAGGDVIGDGGIVPTITGGAAPGDPGNSGFFRSSPFIVRGGAGGGAVGSSGTGGVGGDGGLGCGGGGGGAGVTGGAGGRGGDGYVFIMVF